MMYRGLEKENLRVDAQGVISQEPHPRSLGAALTHPWITTDFSEALLEMITPPEPSILRAHQDLLLATQVVNQHLPPGESLWNYSMPPFLKTGQAVPLAYYGENPLGKMKRIYRQGLCYRYGRAMQVIAGLHYNLSWPQDFFAHWQAEEGDTQALQDFINQKYLGLIRNFFRHAWILPYLFGASPLCFHSSATAERDYLEVLNSELTWGPYATSLRLSDLGYHNRAPDLLQIQYNDLEDYVKSLIRATETPYEPFTEIGVMVEGQARQLSDKLLQMENEYYSPIRPKQIPKAGERPALALLNRGIAYVELRLLDLNPFEAGGLSLEDMAFIEDFLRYCLLAPSPPLSSQALRACQQQIKRVASCGRHPQFKLCLAGEERSFQVAARELLHKLSELPGLNLAALEAQERKLHDPCLLPSVRLIAAVEAAQDLNRFVLEQAQIQRTYLQKEVQAIDVKVNFQEMTEESWRAFEKLEQL